ncbi:hypothetical protein ACFOVU_00375 [Nocardiopsis sediminis]|uniref:Lipoprotein n=1 Tax=Nocardiopsis sediminis TaxID=1778267 RepID=A0ABV8FF00_9ACTN
MTITRSLIAGALAAVATAGCSSSETPDAAGDAAPSSSPPSPEAEPSSPEASPPAPEAADGRDLDACADGDCEVFVSEGDVIHLDGDQRVARLTFTTVTPTEIAVAGSYPDMPDTDMAFVQVDPSVPSDPDQDPTHGINELGLWYLGVNGDEVVVRLAQVEPEAPDAG